MTLHLDDAKASLRRMIYDGLYKAGAPLREVQVAERLGVSRTLARLAMAELETDGLLLREPNRGCRVRAFSARDVADAIRVRGELEGMAARLAAERGLAGPARADWEAALARGDALLDRDLQDAAARTDWIAMNAGFHAAVLTAADNAALVAACQRVSAMPLASPDAILFDAPTVDGGGAAATRRALAAAHGDHHEVYRAVLAREGERAAWLMREHARRSAETKARLLGDRTGYRRLSALPGGKLVRPAFG
eukprot:g13773.t1